MIIPNGCACACFQETSCKSKSISWNNEVSIFFDYPCTTPRICWCITPDILSSNHYISIRKWLTRLRWTVVSRKSWLRLAPPPCLNFHYGDVYGKIRLDDWKDEPKFRVYSYIINTFRTAPFNNFSRSFRPSSLFNLSQHVKSRHDGDWVLLLLVEWIRCTETNL